MISLIDDLEKLYKKEAAMGERSFDLEKIKNTERKESRYPKQLDRMHKDRLTTKYIEEAVKKAVDNLNNYGNEKIKSDIARPDPSIVPREVLKIIERYQYNIEK
jgi:hypothetical protein